VYVNIHFSPNTNLTDLLAQMRALRASLMANGLLAAHLIFGGDLNLDSDLYDRLDLDTGNFTGCNFALSDALLATFPHLHDVYQSDFIRIGQQSTARLDRYMTTISPDDRLTYSTIFDA
jgi:hypothetical protein